MQASRLLSILLRLKTQGRVSARALAEVFEVSVRTIYRDIDALSAAGVPIVAETGRQGGFALRDGYQTRLTGLDRPEAESLFLAGVPFAAEELGLGTAAETMRLKLLAALPESTAHAAKRVAARFHLDPIAWFQGPIRSACCRNSRWRSGAGGWCRCATSAGRGSSSGACCRSGSC